MSDESVLNYKALDDIRALQSRGSSDLLGKIIGMFLDKVPSLVTEIEQGVQESNLEQMWTSAHALKSSSASVGAMQVYEICKQLEAKGRAGEAEGSQQLVALLRQELELATNELKTYLAENSQ